MADVDRYAALLADELGAPQRETPIARILAHAQGIIEAVRRSRTAGKLATLLDAVADKLGIRFEVVSSDEELRLLQERYAAQGETGFVALALGLADPECFGGTVGLLHPRHGIKFISVIDARGAKRYRTYFTKCHEVGHIVLATQQQLLAFRRTHETKHHPEELLVDRVASFLGFYQPLLQPYFVNPLSFDLVQSIIDDLCPEASWESTVRGVVGSWPYPTAWLRAELLLKRREKDARSQTGCGFLTPTAAKLRISDAPALSEGWPAGVNFRKQVRIPPGSVIASVFESGALRAAVEDLGLWDVSGARFPSMPVRVIARRVTPGIVEALVVADSRPT
jgi:hypothetical protein